VIYNKFGQSFQISDKEIDEKVRELNNFNVNEDYERRTELRTVILDVYKSVENFKEDLGQESLDFLLKHEDTYNNVRNALVADLAMKKANIRYDA